jgi:glucose-6-phosphate isomerase
MNGAFIQITAEMVDDLEIPGRGYKFSQLIMAQALGDGAALAERNLPVVRIHLKNTKTGIAKLLTDFN